MKVVTDIQSASASKLAQLILLSCLAGAALLVLAIYALSANPETDASTIVSSLVST